MTEYVPVFKPYKHQVKALGLMKGKPAFALLMEMRTGKTKVLLDDWGAKVTAGKINDLLLIAPGGALYGEDALETQVSEHLPEELKRKTRIVIWRSGRKSSVKEIERLLNYTNGPRILLANVEAFSTVATVRDLCKKFLISGTATMAIDESTTIKGHNSKRSQAILELAPLAKERRILTGLVTPQSPLDLYSQFQFLDPKILGFGSYYGFRARYAIMKKMDFGGRKVNIVVGYRNVDELRTKTEPYSFRIKLEECYDVPPKLYRFRDVEMTDDQKRMYREMREFATTELSRDVHITATAAITQILRLHQMLCGYVVDENGGMHEIKEHRTKALMEILDECEGKAIIWCSYDYNIHKLTAEITKHFGAAAVARFWGGNRSAREEEEMRFKNDSQCRFMLATPAAGGRGREWSVANLIIYYSNSPNLEHRDQSEARGSAIGKFDPVTCIDIRVPRTVDDHIIKNLRAKIDIASAIQGDKYREWLV